MAEAQSAQSASSQSKTNALLAWIFAPFTSFAWKNDADEFVKFHARESLYLGVANIVVSVVLGVLQVCVSVALGSLFYSSLFGFSWVISCGWNLLWLANGAFILVPRLIGVIKANNGEKWTVPVLSDFMKKFIKL